jgi:hypothetical protein
VTDGADTESYPMADFIVRESSCWFSYVVHTVFFVREQRKLEIGLHI